MQPVQPMDREPLTLYKMIQAHPQILSGVWCLVFSECQLLNRYVSSPMGVDYARSSINPLQVACQYPKPVLLDVGEMSSPYAWSPNIGK